MYDYVVIIPARYDSSRLPGKPLVKLGGIPMIVRTWQQCVKVVTSNRVFVATDDIRIQAVCNSSGIPVLMTSDRCLTGTDRVAEAAKLINARVYVNVQGDEPLFNPEDLQTLINSIDNFPQEVLNGFCKISLEDQYRSYSIPKVVMRPDGRLLYMSRATIPSNKKNKFVSAWRQVCAYSFPKAALEAFTLRESKTALEDIEDIEILRFLELGWDVRMIEMSDTSIAVDVPEDVIKAEQEILKRGL